MELCANLEARYMLQPEMGGAQTANLDPVAFMEITKPKAKVGKAVEFDAAGSYQYNQLATRGYVADADLQFKWEFGDGSPAAFGKKVKHSYKAANETPYTATLTVTNRDTHQADTVKRLVLVEVCEGDNCAEDQVPDQSGDPGLRAQGSVVACQSGGGFTSVKVTPAGKGLKFEGATPTGGFKAELYQVAKGRKATARKKLATFDVHGSFTWNGKLKKRKLGKGTYLVYVSTTGNGARPDVRGFGFTRTAKFKTRKPFQRTDSCELLSLARLDTPAFGGKRSVTASVTTTKAAKVTVSVFRGKGKKAARKVTKTTSPNRLLKVKVTPKKLKRGEYRIVISATADGKTQSTTLYAVKY